MGDLYEILNVENVATQGAIKRAYRRLAREWHPDVCAPEHKEASTQYMKRINAAYAVLGDPERRKQYDRAIGVFRCAEHPDRPGLQCKLCRRPLCVHCVQFLGSDRFCETCAGAVRRARDQRAAQKERDVLRREREAIQARRRLRNVIGSIAK